MLRVLCFCILIFAQTANVEKYEITIFDLIASKVSKKSGVPRKLLKAIAIAESGRKIGKSIRPWPWTINCEKKSYYFPNKASAMIYARNLGRRGIKCFDVGFMQINLYFHPTIFKNIREAFDPAINVYQGALLLKKLHKKFYHNWKQAVAAYHSRKKTIGTTYQKKVYNILCNCV